MMLFQHFNLSMSIVVILGLLITIAFCRNEVRRRVLRLPPGPMALPIVGHLHLLGTLPQKSLANLAKKYGSLMYLRLGSADTIVATSPEMASQIFKTYGHVFVNRPRTVCNEILAYGSTSIAFSAYGPYWREARRLCVAHLFSPKKLEAFQNVRREESFKFIRSIWTAATSLQSLNDPISINPHVVAFAATNVSRIAFHKKYVCQALDNEDAAEDCISQSEYDSSSAEHFKKLIFDVFYLSGAFNISDYIPWLGWLDIQGYQKRMIELRKKLDDLLDAIVDDHLRQSRMCPKDEQDTDLVDVLLMAAQDPDSKIRFTRHNIKSICMDMFNGGVDAVVVSSEWAMAELMRNPEILQKLQREIDVVVGKDRRVDESDLPDLKYLHCVVKETFRLHPSAPMLIPRESAEECVIAGYRIPAKTRALVNVWAIGRDPSVWEKPLEFMPERFENANIDPYGQCIQLVPGGAGRRMCPALMLGVTMMQLILANLVHGFDWNVPPPLRAETLDMSETFGLSLPRKEPLFLLPTPRLRSNLYTDF